MGKVIFVLICAVLAFGIANVTGMPRESLLGLPVLFTVISLGLVLKV